GAGSLRDFEPASDGKRYYPRRGKATFDASTSAALFLKSLLDAGFPENQLGDDVSVIEGATVRIIPALHGRTTVPEVEEEVSLPSGERIGIAKLAQATIQKVLAANAGRMETAKLAAEVFKALMNDPNRNDVLRLVTPDFLRAKGRPWIYDREAGLLTADRERSGQLTAPAVH